MIPPYRNSVTIIKYGFKKPNLLPNYWEHERIEFDYHIEVFIFNAYFCIYHYLFAFFDLFSQLPIMTPLAGLAWSYTICDRPRCRDVFIFKHDRKYCFGFLTDKKGPFLILLAGLLLTSVSLFLYQLAFDPLLLLFVRFIHGLHAGLIVPAAFTFIANTAAKNEKGRGVALSGAFIGMAAIMGPAFSGILASRTNEVTVLQATDLPCLFWGFAFLS